jgi:transposase
MTELSLCALQVHGSDRGSCCGARRAQGHGDRVRACSRSRRRAASRGARVQDLHPRPQAAVLEDPVGVELLLVNAHHVKNVPGRKTDVSDAAWLAQLLECGLLKGSFVPPPVIARLRDLTRYRKKLVEARAAETQRIQKLLEDAGLKLDSVVSVVVSVVLLGKSARETLDALIAGVHDPRRLAERARTRMPPRSPRFASR